MSLITQYSRISHHTITSGTFSIPSQENFTLVGTGSWTAEDLCKSEFGVNEDTNKTSIRIGTNIHDVLTSNLVGYGLRYDGSISLNADTGSTVSNTGSTFSLYNRDLGTGSFFQTAFIDVTGNDENVDTYFQFSFYRSFKNINGIATLVGTQSDIHSVNDFGTFSYNLSIQDNNNLRLNVNCIDSRTFSWFYEVSYK